MKTLLGLLVVLVVAVGGGYWYWSQSTGSKAPFKTAIVERGDLVVSINATGIIEPEEVVDVGAQVAGMITSMGKDPRDPKRTIDFGSPVEVDTILAHIDPAIYQSQVDQAQAQLEQAQAMVESAKALVGQAQANVSRAQADLGQMQAKLFQADRDWNRAQKLRETKGAIADADYDAAESAFKTAGANVGVGQAAIEQAKAGLVDAQAAVSKAQAGVGDATASLKRAKTNLAYCTIKSPVKGVIIARRVNVGQTVVSSLNAPSLFLIAKDLRRLQVWAQVNEADVGQIRSGQEVRFTIDAFPGRPFKGVVAPDQPRLDASTTSNVTTYTVVVNTDNPDGRLIPYLTANLEFEAGRHTNVLLVPNSALRWKPNPQLIAPDARGDNGKAAASRPRSTASAGEKRTSSEKDRSDRGTVWIEEDGFVRPVPVRLGPSDGTRTEILGGALKENDQIVIGEVRRDNGGGGTVNPFTPQQFRSGSRPQ